MPAYPCSLTLTPRSGIGQARSPPGKTAMFFNRPLTGRSEFLERPLFPTKTLPICSKNSGSFSDNPRSHGGPFPSWLRSGNRARRPGCGRDLLILQAARPNQRVAQACLGKVAFSTNRESDNPGIRSARVPARPGPSAVLAAALRNELGPARATQPSGLRGSRRKRPLPTVRRAGAEANRRKAGPESDSASPA